ncbi:hypothetical protein SCALM49S_02024 [Streptomyces californicus]
MLLLGGRVRGSTIATVDHWASKMLAGFVIDLAYVGANGISREYGLTTPDPAVSEVKAQAMRSSRRRVFAGIHFQLRRRRASPVRRRRRQPPDQRHRRLLLG